MRPAIRNVISCSVWCDMQRVWPFRHGKARSESAVPKIFKDTAIVAGISWRLPGSSQTEGRLQAGDGAARVVMLPCRDRMLSGRTLWRWRKRKCGASPVRLLPGLAGQRSLLLRKDAFCPVRFLGQKCFEKAMRPHTEKAAFSPAPGAQAQRSCAPDK